MVKPKLIWAVDPFGKDKAFQLKVGRTLLRLAKAKGAVVEPVCVLSPDELRVPKTVFRPDGGPYRLAAEKTLQAWVKLLKSKSLLAPTLLVEEDYSVRSAVASLVRYAHTSGAETIGVGTHSRRALYRFFLGSFAETLMLMSDVPVFLVSPRVGKELKTNSILFATDFSEKSEKAFSGFLKLAREQKARVVLFHKLQFEVPPPFYGVDITPVYQEYLEENQTEKKGVAQRWIQKARSQGVSATVLFDDKPGYTLQALFAAVKKHKVGVIAMAAQSGSIAAALLGSLCRQVVRQAPVPVWIIHPTL